MGASFRHRGAAVWALIGHRQFHLEFGGLGMYVFRHSGRLLVPPLPPSNPIKKPAPGITAFRKILKNSPVGRGQSGSLLAQQREQAADFIVHVSRRRDRAGDLVAQYYAIPLPQPMRGNLGGVVGDA